MHKVFFWSNLSWKNGGRGRGAIILGAICWGAILLLPLQKSLMKLEHSEKWVWNIFLKKKPVYLKIFNVPSSPKLLKSKELMESRFFQIAIKHEGKILPRKGGKSEILLREIFFYQAVEPQEWLFWAFQPFSKLTMLFLLGYNFKVVI